MEMIAIRDPALWASIAALLEAILGWGFAHGMADPILAVLTILAGIAACIGVGASVWRK
jgi:hypothetical protein